MSLKAKPEGCGVSLRAKDEICEVEATPAFISSFRQSVGVKTSCRRSIRSRCGHCCSLQHFLSYQRTIIIEFSICFVMCQDVRGVSVLTNVSGSGFISPGPKKLALNPLVARKSTFIVKNDV